MKMSRVWAMPSKNTFDCKPIGNFINLYMAGSTASIDPFARNCQLATFRNDINPNTRAEHHMDAVDFLRLMAEQKWTFDLAILDPPYSPTQITREYAEAGLKCSQTDTQNSRLYSGVKTALYPLLLPDSIVLSFGWNSAGMGKKFNFETIEIMLVNHGGAHNDTICLAERRK